ncbi:MAG TPA: hypothetical protein DIT01_17050 [Lentisphaeria bacterium]|nr:hypothetical protein [Lentisphaeria bacterium]
MLTIGGIACAAAENLGDVLRESGWDRIIGTWVDAETKGSRNKTTYAWRFKDRVIEITSWDSWDGEKESVSLIGLNPRTGDVFNLSADSQGASSLGRWTVGKDGEAILDLMFVSGEGQEGILRIRQAFKDNDTLIVTIDLPEPIVFEMVRVKKSQPAANAKTDDWLRQTWNKLQAEVEAGNMSAEDARAKMIAIKKDVYEKQKK